MIDEELYQQAADELNSDRRKAHLWARACALASEDHDEARFLYTNLRVEEMLAERESKAKTSSAAPIESVSIPPLTLEPLDLDTDMLSSAVADNQSDPIESTRLGISSSDSKTSLDASELFDRGDPAQAQRPASERNRITLEGNSKEELDLDPSHLEQMNDAETTAISAIDGAPLNTRIEEALFNEIDDEHDFTIPEADTNETVSTDVSDDAGNNPGFAGNDVDFAEFEPIAEPAIETSTRQDAVDELISDLSKQAKASESSWRENTDEETLPSPLHDTSKLPPAPDHSTNAFTEDLERQVEELTEHNNAIDMPVDTGIEKAVALPSPGQILLETDGHYDAGHYEFGEPVEVDTTTDLMDAGGSRLYSVYKHFEKHLQVVKQGLCWPALFVTLPWLLYRRLFGTAATYALLWLVTLSGLVVGGLAWLDAGDQATTALKLTTLAFALISVVGLLFIPFLYGNAWRARKLEKRGYELATEVYAPNATIARTHAQQRLGRA